MTEPRVTAVVVNWNGFDETRRCIESLRRVDYRQLRIIVVDNGSTDGSAERLEAEFTEAKLVGSKRNRGFAGGANLGIRDALDAGADYAWLLNNDAEVGERTLEALLAAAERDPRVGIVGVEACRVSRWTAVAGPGDRLDYVAGACMLIRRTVLEEVGLFDETYFFYYEDADLCLRARRAGWKLAVAPDARIQHRGGVSVNRGSSGRSDWADRLQAESGGIFVGKHFGVRGPAVVALRLAGVAANRLDRPRRAASVARAFLRGFARGRAGAATRQSERRRA
jgi:GT2 family glycosyltransferase